MKKSLSILLAVMMLLASFSSVNAYALTVTVRAVVLSKNSSSLEGVDAVVNEKPCFDVINSSSIGSDKISGYFVDSSYNTSPFIKGVSWYDDTEKKYLNESSIFVSGHKYILKVRVSCKDNFEYAYSSDVPSVTCELYTGSQYVSCTAEEVVPKKTINVVKEFVCEGVSTVDSVYVLLQSPQSGAVPSSAAVVADTSKGVEIDTDEDDKYIDNKVKWTLVTELGEIPMKKDEFFIKGLKYRAYIRLKTKTGYEFKTESETKSAVVAKIGGNDSEVEATSSEKKLSQYITIYHSQPVVCSDSTGTEINLKIDISNCTVNEKNTEYTYNGSAQNADIEVKYAVLTLKEGSDYEIVYSGNRTNAGTVNYTINGIGNYEGSIAKSFVIKPLKATPSVTLSATKYTYDGKEKKPTVTVKVDGKKLGSSMYSVAYKTGRKNVGKYSAKVTLKGNYSGTKTAYYVINPKGTSLLTKKTCKKDSITVNWTKQTAQTNGYEIEYSTSSKFTGSKKAVISKNTTASKKITGLKKNKKYYFRIRTYKNVTENSKTVKYYSSWSASKNFTTLK